MHPSVLTSYCCVVQMWNCTLLLRWFVSAQVLAHLSRFFLAPVVQPSAPLVHKACCRCFCDLGVGLMRGLFMCHPREMARDRGTTDGSPPRAHGAARARRPTGPPASVGGNRGHDLGQDLGPRSRLCQAVGEVCWHAFFHSARCGSAHFVAVGLTWWVRCSTTQRDRGSCLCWKPAQHSSPSFLRIESYPQIQYARRTYPKFSSTGHVFGGGFHCFERWPPCAAISPHLVPSHTCGIPSFAWTGLSCSLKPPVTAPPWFP